MDGDIDLDVEASVTPGGVYEIRVLLQRCGPEAAADLGLTALPLAFHDGDGAPLDPRLICGPPVPHLDPMLIETVPHGALDDHSIAAAFASRFAIAPPDAAGVRVGPPETGVALVRCEVRRLHVLWSAAEAKLFAKHLTDVGALRRTLIEVGVPEGAHEALPGRRQALAAMEDHPRAQVAAIQARFQPMGNWEPTLRALLEGSDQEDFQVRMRQLRDQAVRLPKVAFIGSPRGFERVAGMADTFWLREGRAEEQLAILRPNLVVIESASESGFGDEIADWQLAFSSLDGRLPPRGKALLDAAAARGIPVRLWITASAREAGTWAGCAVAATAAIRETTSADDGLAADPFYAATVLLGTCPTACSMGAIRERDLDLMLVPTGSDLFQFPDFADLVAAQSSSRTLVAEFTYRFVSASLDLRLGGRTWPTFSDPSRLQQRALMQAAGLVLLPAVTLRSQATLTEIALDATACGAIPVIYGAPSGQDGFLGSLDHVQTPVELMELQGLLRVPWLRDRRWRQLMRRVMRHHVWTSADRQALLGYDPFPDGFDTPRITAIMVSRRPHLIKRCLDTFRRQSWANKELVLVLNLDHPPDLPGDLRENERVFVLPTASNIGECLNHAIAQATGCAWAKMDDDDFYVTTYLEDTVTYFRASQADVVGRQSVFFYFADQDETSGRVKHMRRCNTILSAGHISGATLAARTIDSVQPFSFRDRNAADSNWVQRMVHGGTRTFSGDGTGIVVYRDADEALHTWHFTGVKSLIDTFLPCSSGNIFSRLNC